jgi:hypothetical protein
VIFFLALVAFCASAADRFQELNAKRYSSAAGRLGVIVLEVNWGRQWGCGGYDNVQIQRLSFSPFSSHAVDTDGPELRLKTPSMLFVDNAYVLMALLIEPGTYALTGFDIKVARSVSDVGHIIGTSSELIRDGKPVGGTFSVYADEIIYLGHFSLDCDEGIIPWRYYLSDRSEFERYVAMLRERFPFMADAPVEFRLFSTTAMGKPFSLEKPVVLGNRKPD